MATLLDCFNLLSDICDRLTTTKTLPSKPDKSIDQAAIAAAEEIIGIYSAVQTAINERVKEDEKIHLERRALGDNFSGVKPRSSYYRYWTDFNPDIAISVLNKLIRTCDRKLTKIIEKLTEIVKPFRIQEQEIVPHTLGLKSYQFNPYAIWVNSFSDHKLPYKVWLAQL
jgi:hypothetical protein